MLQDGVSVQTKRKFRTKSDSIAKFRFSEYNPMNPKKPIVTYSAHAPNVSSKSISPQSNLGDSCPKEPPNQPAPLSFLKKPLIFVDSTTEAARSRKNVSPFYEYFELLPKSPPFQSTDGNSRKKLRTSRVLVAALSQSALSDETPIILRAPFAEQNSSLLMEQLRAGWKRHVQALKPRKDVDTKAVLVNKAAQVIALLSREVRALRATILECPQCTSRFFHRLANPAYDDHNEAGNYLPDDKITIEPTAEARYKAGSIVTLRGNQIFL